MLDPASRFEGSSAERAIRGEETMHVGTLGVPLKGSVKVPRSVDRGARRSEYDEEASCPILTMSHAATRQIGPSGSTDASVGRLDDNPSERVADET